MKPFNQRGTTLLEILFALGILILGTYLVVEGVNQMEESSRESQLLSLTERQSSEEHTSELQSLA